MKCNYSLNWIIHCIYVIYYVLNIYHVIYAIFHIQEFNQKGNENVNKVLELSTRLYSKSYKGWG